MCVCVCVCVCMQMCVSVQTALAYNYNTSSSKGGLGVPLVSGLMVLPLTNVFELESVLEKAATNSSKTWAACSWSTFFGGGGGGGGGGSVGNSRNSEYSGEESQEDEGSKQEHTQAGPRVQNTRLYTYLLSLFSVCLLLHKRAGLYSKGRLHSTRGTSNQQMKHCMFGLLKGLHGWVN